jgi:outer membrane protein assembly factor BamE (lipoprotein component of BamABCDE complex)
MWDYLFTYNRGGKKKVDRQIVMTFDIETTFDEEIAEAVREAIEKVVRARVAVKAYHIGELNLD